MPPERILDDLPARWRANTPPANTADTKTGARRAYEILVARYSEPGRHYHTLAHLAHCFYLADTMIPVGIDRSAIDFAIWMHDIVYVPGRPDSEEQSVQLADDLMQRVYGSQHWIGYDVPLMIRATKTHTVPTPERAIEREALGVEGRLDQLRYFLDIDLGILGEAPDAFDAYDENIRREYHFVPDPDYRAGRVKVLRSFLDRAWIYQTPEFRRSHEEQARENLTRSIARLEGSPCPP